MDPVVNSQLKGLDTSSSDSLPSTILLEPWGEEDILQSPQSASSLSFSDDSTELPPLKRQKFVLPASSTLSTAATTPSAAPLTLTQPPSAPTCNVPCSSTPLQGNPSPESASLPPFQKARFVSNLCHCVFICFSVSALYVFVYACMHICDHEASNTIYQ